MEPRKLSLVILLKYLNQAIMGMKDPRLASNATKHSLLDAVLGAFSVFFMQSESFLEHQRHMERNQGKSNATNLFGMIKVPTVPQIRNIVDGISATSLSSVFSCVYQALRRDGHLKPFQYLGGLLIALDGTQYFDSHKVNWCKLIHTRESDGKILDENAFITRHELNEQTVPLVTEAGRSRWKTENENHNVLKTKGYHLEHNFGHGQEHLASCLLTLNLLAFLFHTVLHLTDLAYTKHG